MRTNIRIGPAGWSYKDWNGIVYPRSRPVGFHEASYLANYFPLIEINTLVGHGNEADRIS